MIIGKKYIKNKNFDIFDNTVIVDLEVEKELWILTFVNHKLVEKDIIKLN